MYHNLIVIRYLQSQTVYLTMIEAQLLKISTEYTLVPIHKFKTVRKINKYTISDFIAKLSCESWDTIFNSEDVNTVFSSFLNIYLKIFYSSFPLKK